MFWELTHSMAKVRIMDCEGWYSPSWPWASMDNAGNRWRNNNHDVADKTRS